MCVCVCVVVAVAVAVGGAVIYSLYHREFYGSDLQFWGEFYGLTKDGQPQFKSSVVITSERVCGEDVWLNFVPALTSLAEKTYFIVLTYCLSISLCTSWFLHCCCRPHGPAFLIKHFSMGAEKRQSINQLILDDNVMLTVVSLLLDVSFVINGSALDKSINPPTFRWTHKVVWRVFVSRPTKI